MQKRTLRRLINRMADLLTEELAPELGPPHLAIADNPPVKAPLRPQKGQPLPTVCPNDSKTAKWTPATQFLHKRDRLAAEATVRWNTAQDKLRKKKE